jgi:hypothetical protein
VRSNSKINVVNVCFCVVALVQHLLQLYRCLLRIISSVGCFCTSKAIEVMMCDSKWLTWNCLNVSEDDSLVMVRVMASLCVMDNG